MQGLGFSESQQSRSHEVMWSGGVRAEGTGFAVYRCCGLCVYYLHTCIYIYMCMCLCVRTHVYIYIYTYTYKHIYIYINMYIDVDRWIDR